MFDATKYGPWALIAGGSEGVGESFARKLAADGINLVLVARKPGPLDELAQKVRDEYGVEVRALSLDLTRADVLDRLIEITGDIDVGLLIYNAGDANGVIPFVQHKLDTALHSVRLSVVTQTTLAHHFGSKMVARGQGGIILIGSMAGNAGTLNMATYSGAKAYTQLFGEALWAEMKPLGVDVLVQVLGATDTPLRRRMGIIDTPEFPVQSPDDVAQQALDELADGGPVTMPPPLKEVFYSFSSMPRREAAETMRDQVLAWSPD